VKNKIKIGKITKINNFFARLHQLATQRSTFALTSGQPALFASGDCNKERTCCWWVTGWSEELHL